MDGIGFGAYRSVKVDHAVAVRVVGPDGAQYRQMSRGASWIRDRLPDEVKADRFVKAALWPLNALHRKLEDNAERADDVLDRFTSSTDGCREVQDAAFAALHIPTKEAREHDGSYWLKPPKHLYTRVADAVLGMRMMTAALTLAGVFDGKDPSKIDARLSRIEGKSSRLEMTRRGLRLDVDARYRLIANPDHAPRYDDPRFYRLLQQGLDEIGAPAAVGRACALGYAAGARFVSVSSFDMYGLLVLSKKPGHYPTRNKGDGVDERSFTMIVGDAEHRRLLEWVAGERAERSGYSLERLRTMAEDPDQHVALKGMPVITEDGVGRLKYGRLWRIFRRAAIAMDLFIDDDAYRATRRKRFVTFHYLRHEYVHRRMDRARLMPSEAKRAAEKAAIKQYMCWRSDAMLAWYSKHYEVKHADRSAEEFSYELDVASESQMRAPVGPVFDAEVDELFDEAFA